MKESISSSEDLSRVVKVSAKLVMISLTIRVTIIRVCCMKESKSALSSHKLMIIDLFEATLSLTIFFFYVPCGLFLTACKIVNQTT